MGFTKTKIILPLVFILVIISLLRVLKLTIVSSSYSPSSVHPVFALTSIKQQGLPEKEIRFLLDIIRQKSPCNVLVFGFEHDYIKLHNINKGGTSVFLENNLEKVKDMKGEFKMFNATFVYKVEYKTYAKDAYKLLKHARSSPSCDMNSGMSNIMSECKLGLTGLPKEVMETKWDVIVVDGPCGDGPGSPGRMGSIFMASVLARAGNGTNVVVHDTDQMIENWFSWEFLCEENRVSSKGRFWNFKVPNLMIENNSSHFCSH
ncbi:arabinogalactan O-methyltransferase 2-like [Bidens hawaiensis]|uniref:arabinogalactan O-methyltransferase 2-like n=1 Tax=Bidens hawaiensis TaxID=980011 RepID=UPI004049A520